MENRKRLVYFLEENLHLATKDPLYHTKTFLKIHGIQPKPFFKWLIEEASQYNYNVNSDKGVKNLLQ